MAEMLGVCCEKKSEVYTCPMTQFVNLISGKWAIPILYRLIVINAPVRFGDLLRAAYPITQKELTKQLRLFEQRGLVTRTVYPEIPPRVEYQITGLGLTLQDALSPLAAWMSEYGDQLERQTTV
ncbi:winged helix-turn-helix transcriptional regulator [Enterobacter asburiae]